MTKKHQSADGARGKVATAQVPAEESIRQVITAGASMLISKGVVSQVVEWIAPLAFLFLLLHQMMGPAFFSSERYLGLPGDTNQYMWYIGWIWHALETQKSPFISHAFGYPSFIDIMNYTSVSALGLVFGWLYTFTSVVFVYNLIVVVNYTLIFVFGKLTFSTLGISRVFSGIGGLLFCLMPYLTAQGAGHLHLTFIAPIFLVGYLVARLIHSVQRPGWMLGAGTGLALTLAFYTSLETFSTMVIFVIILYGYALLTSVKSTLDFTARLLNVSFLAGSIASLLLVIPGVVNFAQGQAQQPFDLAFLSVDYSNDLLGAIVPSQLYLIHNQATMAIVAHFTGNLVESDGYLSIPFIALFTIYAIRNWREPKTRILTYASVSLAILSLGPVLHIDGTLEPVPLPWSLMLRIPLVRDLLPTRLTLYVAYLAIILVVWGADESVRQMPRQLRSVKLNISLVATIGALALVALLWLPLLPTYSSLMPSAVSILRRDQVVSQYIAHEPTLVLYDHNEAGFSVVMGVLAASNNYGLVTSNIYGPVPTMASSPSFKVNEAFLSDTNDKQTDEALRRYLPVMGVGRVMFISVDNQPISAQQLAEVSQALGTPIYDSQRLVVVWRVPRTVRS
ncbi:MAG: hypothetical protein ACLQUY_06325 [Ktedonobacterales bacterium]